MNGAILYASKYGSTHEYADWIADATGLPIYEMKAHDADPAGFDFLVLGSPVIYYKLIAAKWMQRHLNTILDKPTVLFTVSGAPAGKKLEGWIADCLPLGLPQHMHHVALRGRQVPKDLTWFDRIMLIIGGLMNRDRKAGREERQGFDFMDKSSIAPVVALVQQLQSREQADAVQ